LFASDVHASMNSIRKGLEVTLKEYPSEAPSSPHGLLLSMARLPSLLAKVVLRI
jgi:hypothetical protein